MSNIAKQKEDKKEKTKKIRIKNHQKQKKSINATVVRFTLSMKLHLLLPHRHTRALQHIIRLRSNGPQASMRNTFPSLSLRIDSE